ncbi:MAG: phosphatidylserine decarboxylase [Gammaproteobacteria bacterium]|nr:phosphatidylserine decarboxylase [Gammaproteobacteria bacterium]
MFKKISAFLQYVLPTRFLSRCVGYFAHNQCRFLKNILIKRFIKHYHVDMSEAKKSNIHDYKSFNDFFTRQLKPQSRIINTDPDAIICPVDGFVSQLGNIHNNTLIQAKGKNYKLKDLIISQKYVDRFIHGKFATLYLSPRDYHHIHMPTDGKLVEMIYVPGRLFAVNPPSVQTIPNLFAKNERVICYFETNKGVMAIILVGALFVGSIHTAWAGKITPNRSNQIQSYNYSNKNITLKRGERLGHFELGSTVILLFEPHQMDWNATGLKPSDRVKMGQKIAIHLL